MVNAQTNKSQALYALFFVGIIVTGFLGVAYVSYAFETEDQMELLYITDATSEFTNVPYAESLVYSNSWFYNSCQRISATPGVYAQYNKTMVYLGNNTYTTAVINIASNPAMTSNYLITALSVPELPNWLVKKVIINTTLPGDTDQLYGLSFNTHDNPHAARAGDLLYSSDLSGNTAVSSHAFTPGATSALYEDVLSLTTSLDIYDKAQEKDLHTLSFVIGDSAINGMSAFDLNVTIEIWGVNVAAWSAQDSILAVLSASTVLNVIAGTYALDRVDIGGYVKTLRKPRRK